MSCRLTAAGRDATVRFATSCPTATIPARARRRRPSVAVGPSPAVERRDLDDGSAAEVVPLAARTPGEVVSNGVLELAAAAAPVLSLAADPALAAAVAARAGLDRATVDQRLADLIGEARLALAHLGRAELGLAPGQRVLEIGAGTGLVSAILTDAGLRVTALEPVVDGFDLFPHVHAALAERRRMPTLDRREARDLHPDRDGRFDRIVSVNVLEHCRPLGPTLDALAAVLAPGGRMLHACPNYRVPYEPHLGRWLVPGRPGWTERLAPALARDPVWRSLNFVTAGDLARWARRHGLALTLAPRVVDDAVARLAHDPAFARRQGGVATLARWLHRSGALSRVPASWATPMVAIVARPA